MTHNKSGVIERLKALYIPNVIETYGDVNLPKAAVLVPIFFRNGDLHVLLTVRGKHLRSHGGDVAFPGGKMDEGDSDLLVTALREAEEEIGLPRETVEIVCQCVPFCTRNGIMVAPFIGFIDDDFTPAPNAHEVSDVFSMPISDFLSAKNHRYEEYSYDNGFFMYVHFFEYIEKDKIFSPWGITALICIVVAVIALQRQPEFTINTHCVPDDPVQMLLFLFRKGIDTYKKGKFSSRL
ncbi:uncharacterized protein LOC100376725 [Saccoglossus kowalevskii]|uniref:Peroxisomal coenzyme A diphosphatase NUDT7-like n=1 Tax=Saccoglossus kowalevskii TaxID=10224 RepID=A0ABM0GR38_SACKO|nr:PREDICTED: peroxisomal coenzyme A diphosphatase NUDT7-like [Saccoglossus kowalevskii]